MAGLLRGCAGGALGVALSGGRDSLALLRAALHVARPLGLTVWALHVNHGWQADAGQWQAWCERLVASWAAEGWSIQVACTQVDVPGACGRGESVESVARRLRYDALTSMAAAVGVRHVLLAHHLDDQAETVLLQALRGGGAKALAGMPAERRSAGVSFLRPWLACPRQRIERWLGDSGAAWLDDPSNADTQWRRNALRATVMPALARIHPQASAQLMRTSQKLAESARLEEALAAMDWRELMGDGTSANAPSPGAPGRSGSHGGPAGLDWLPVWQAAWTALDDARWKNLLRHWPGQLQGVPGDQEQESACRWRRRLWLGEERPLPPRHGQVRLGREWTMHWHRPGPAMPGPRPGEGFGGGRMQALQNHAPEGGRVWLALVRHTGLAREGVEETVRPSHDRQDSGVAGASEAAPHAGVVVGAAKVRHWQGLLQSLGWDGALWPDAVPLTWAARQVASLVDAEVCVLAAGADPSCGGGADPVPTLQAWHAAMLATGSGGWLIRPRRPDDRFRWAPDRPRRPLKLQFQSAGVAEAGRMGWVLSDAEGRLLAVPGLGWHGGSVEQALQALAS